MPIFTFQFAVILVVGCGLWRVGRAQPVLRADTLVTPSQVERLARFEQATALAVDPSGRLYVTDAGADVVVQLAPDGSVLMRAGGPGTHTGAFDEPTDVDPTNGLAIFVADAGNGRIQRFAREFRFLETIPVGGDAEGPVRSTYDREAGGRTGGTGEPIAVVSTSADALYAIDAAAGHVVHWEPGRRTVQTLGGFNDGPGALDEPVALALDRERRLYVADRGRGAVVVYDAFGSFLATLADGRVNAATGLFVADDRLWVVTVDELMAYDETGHPEGRWTVRLDAPLVDATRHRGTTYLLTTNALYRLLNEGSGKGE